MEELTTYEFRPLPGFFTGIVQRYNNGLWTEDDGEYDLAFIGRNNGAPNICLYFSHHYYDNLCYSWLTGSWRDSNHAHPRSNPWHYAEFLEGAGWGNYIGAKRERSANQRAGNSGMNELVKQYQCANGRHIGFRQGDDKHIIAGLVRAVDTKLPAIIPFELLECMYCKEKPSVRAGRDGE